MKRPNHLKAVSLIETIHEVHPEVPIKERLGVKTLEAVLMDFESDGIPDYDEIIKALK